MNDQFLSRGSRVYSPVVYTRSFLTSRVLNSHRLVLPILMSANNGFLQHSQRCRLKNKDGRTLPISWHTLWDELNSASGASQLLTESSGAKITAARLVARAQILKRRSRNIKGRGFDIPPSHSAQLPSKNLMSIFCSIIKLTIRLTVSWILLHFIQNEHFI